jgi:hypothetical protein
LSNNDESQKLKTFKTENKSLNRYISSFFVDINKVQEKRDRYQHQIKQAVARLCVVEEVAKIKSSK